ncbi:MAG: hypothetical protein L6R38_003563 [Xanthoria sp. 2 TBL-2021]|nr:MAG: hypothetical protein L6R38_003563 [Xanthoria sp. 2 TBL-2021]
MHPSISLCLAASSLYVAHVIAAPAGSSPNARDVSPSQSISTSATLTTPDIDLATVTPAPAQKRQAVGAIGDINILEEFVLPQSISSSSSSSSSSPTFAFVITRPTPPARMPAPVQKRQARGDINILEEFVLPQSISSSPSSSLPSSTFAFVITRPTRPAAVPVKLAERDAQKGATNEDKTFGPLADLVFPQMMSSSSSSSSASPSSTPAFELSPSRHPLAAPIDGNP